MKNLLLCVMCLILCCALSACGTDVVTDAGAGEDALKNRLIYGPDFDPNADNSAYTINGEVSTNPQDSNEPGSARPVTIYYNGHIYSHDGYITYDLPDDFDFIGETNNVGNSSKTEDFAANEDGYLYKSIENDELIYFQWKEWDEAIDGGEEPYLLLFCKEQ